MTRKYTDHGPLERASSSLGARGSYRGDGLVNERDRIYETVREPASSGPGGSTYWLGRQCNLGLHPLRPFALGTGVRDLFRPGVRQGIATRQVSRRPSRRRGTWSGQKGGITIMIRRSTSSPSGIRAGGSKRGLDGLPKRWRATQGTTWWGGTTSTRAEASTTSSLAAPSFPYQLRRVAIADRRRGHPRHRDRATGGRMNPRRHTVRQGARRATAVVENDGNRSPLVDTHHRSAEICVAAQAALGKTSCLCGSRRPRRCTGPGKAETVPRNSCADRPSTKRADRVPGTAPSRRGRISATANRGRGIFSGLESA